jgi:hypothetical protein
MGRFPEKRTSRRWSDEELEYYAELYLGRTMREAGVEFETFLSNPDYYLLKYPRRDGQRDGGPTRRPHGLRHFFGLRPTSRASSK